MKKSRSPYVVETFAIALSAICILIASYFLVEAYTIEQVQKRVRDTMLECRAFHEYVQHDMHPEYYRLMQNGRLPVGFYAPQMLSSSYIARSIQDHYNKIRNDAGLPEIKYKMAAENPRNPKNQADSFEVSLIRMFNQNRSIDNYHQVITEFGKKYLLSARPFLEVKKSCLKCHGSPDDAPQELKKEYNWTSGFNLKAGNIVAVEMVRSPLEGEFSGIIVTMILISLGLVIVVMLLVFNTRLRSLVSKKTRLLIESEERNRVVIEDIPVLLCRFRPDGTITYVNEVCSSYFKKPPEVLLGQSVQMLIDETERDAVWGQIQSMSEKDSIRTFELKVNADHEAQRLQRWKCRAVFDENSAIVAYQIMGEDITDVVEAQRTLAAERERLAVSLRSIGDGVISVDVEGKIDIVNRVAEKLTGWKQADARGKPFEDVFRIVNRETRIPCENPILKILSSGEIIELQENTVLIASDGTERIIADSGAPIRDSNSVITGVVLVFRDVTEKTKYQEIYNRTAKLDSLAVLAGGIAHDFNNLLGGIYGYSDMARDETDITEVKRYLDMSIGTIDRARGLTQQLLTFSKGGLPAKKVQPLFPFIEENARFSLCGSNCELTCRVQENLWTCDIDRNQIGQVIDNVVINAKQAMSQGGRVEINARNVVVQKHTDGVLQPGKYVKISLRDTGPGIPAEILGKIFDPFFTTKNEGHGLGLATCNSVIERHGGCIEVESEINRGTTFHLFIPADTQSLQEIKPEEVNVHSGKGNVLVMDDEEVMRTAITNMLLSMGYSVIACKNGEEIIEHLMNVKDVSDIRAFLFDLTIKGGMGGLETLNKIRKLNTAIPIFVTSGYSEDPVMANPQKYGFIASIQKPFRKSELIEVLNRFLNNE